MPAAAEGGVDKEAAPFGLQQLEGLLEQDGLMICCTHEPPSPRGAGTQRPYGSTRPRHGHLSASSGGTALDPGLGCNALSSDKFWYQGELIGCQEFRRSVMPVC